MPEEKVFLKNGKVMLDSNKEKWPSSMQKMDKNLLDWIRKLSMEHPNEAQGRAVPPEIYEEAINWMTSNQPDIKLISSQTIMNLTGTSNTLFCGHFIYPESSTGEKIES